MVCSIKSENISGDIRFNWVKNTYINNDNIKVYLCEDENPQKPEECSSVDEFYYKYWNPSVYSRIDFLDAVFTSENYGEEFAKYLGVKHILVDLDRKKYPISGTLIREQPLKYWDFIPKSVRPYYTKKVCIVGTESTGKSTMTKLLSNFYGVPQAREMGREICDDTKTCNIEMLNEIIEAQAVEITENLGDKILFSDTDSLTTICYGKYLFNQVPTTVTNEIEKINDFDIYLFLWNDVPFVDDGSRMGEPHRSEFHQLLYETFKNKNVYYIKGTDFEERFNRCVEIIDNYLENK